MIHFESAEEREAEETFVPRGRETGEARFARVKTGKEAVADKERDGKRPPHRLVCLNFR